MGNYIPLEELEQHIRTEKIKATINNVKDNSIKILTPIGQSIISTGKFVGNGLGKLSKHMAETMENNNQSAQSPLSSNKGQKISSRINTSLNEKDSYLKGIAENFAFGSFSEHSNLASLNPYKQEVDKHGIRKKNK